MATVAVGARTYFLWKEGPWDLPSPGKAKTLPAAGEEKSDTKAPPLVGTDVIVSKNLFDPERGEGRNREAETNSQAFQRVRGMVLLGTAILGNNRYAVLRDGAPTPVPGPGRGVPAQAPSLMRLKLGDNVEGFRLSEIGDKRVVFTKGTANVEVLLDYFRKPDPLPASARVPARPGVPAPAFTPRTPGAGPSTVPQLRAAPAPLPNRAPPAPRVLPNLPRRQRVPIPPGE